MLIFVKFLFNFHNHHSQHLRQGKSVCFADGIRRTEKPVPQSNLRSTSGSGSRCPQVQPKTPSASPDGLSRWPFPITDSCFSFQPRDLHGLPHSGTCAPPLSSRVCPHSYQSHLGPNDWEDQTSGVGNGRCNGRCRWLKKVPQFYPRAGHSA